MSETFGHSTPRPYFEDPYTVAFHATVQSLRTDSRGERWPHGIQEELRMVTNMCSSGPGTVPTRDAARLR